MLKAGIDIGSTTIKLVVCDADNHVIHSDYRRHNTYISPVLNETLTAALTAIGNKKISLVVTGSAGIGISERFGFPFIQEVVASAGTVKRLCPQASTLIDLGGEDAKMIFFEKNRTPDIRMNGSCAGGTGAFIDQMATLLNVSVSELNQLALNSKSQYTIASRCGVFAKTDIQNLLSKNINKEDIAAAVFNAVAQQTVNSLMRGFNITPKVLLCGGPFTFFSYLRKAFVEVLKISEKDIIIPELPAFIPAMGAAFSADISSDGITVSELINLLQNAPPAKTDEALQNPLFTDKAEYNRWQKTRSIIRIEKGVLNEKAPTDCYIGIDVGSTTTKIAVIDTEDRLLYDFYANNNGATLETVTRGLAEFMRKAEAQNRKVHVVKTAVTGYGEDLIKAALGFDHGIVETMAHFIAARKMDDKVSFIIDIGGQDIKAIFVQNDAIEHIEINEACSSGCGSFIESFSKSLGFKVADFASLACEATAPCDLGTRCTVFMNSKVKQSLREGASTENIAAGLSYSVIKNCLHKVLKINDISQLGGNIVAQGGTFKNQSVLRTLEKLTSKKITVSDKPELMGAFGSALYAKRQSDTGNKKSRFIGFENLDKAKDYKSKTLKCKGCNNFCAVNEIIFPNGNKFYTGNNCENIFHSKIKPARKGGNIYKFKDNLLFKRTSVPQQKPLMRIGIPRILNMFENFPFWNSLFVECGIEVVLSGVSDDNLYKKGTGSIMSDNICFPAKLAHGHVIDLVEKKVDRIFFPLVIFESNEYPEAANSFNCPIVTGYSEVLKSAIDTEKNYNIPFDSPSVNFNDRELLEAACRKYLEKLGVKKSIFKKALANALDEQISYKKKITAKLKDIVAKAKKDNNLVIMLAGHPYHTDPLINHKTAQLLEDFGVDVINEEIVNDEVALNFGDYFTVPQWAYPNRILNAASWVARNNDNIEFVQLNSFGCGPDSFITNEISNILKINNKIFTLIRLDEIQSTGSVFLRLRSLIESIKVRKESYIQQNYSPETTFPVYTKEDKHKTIIVPWFSDFYSPFVPTLFDLSGYKVVNLPPSDKTSAELGLKYANNEICYPATLIVGDIIKALQSGEFNPNEIAVGMTQTGGQCRATNYLSLIKRAMTTAGFDNIPVISVAAASGIYNQQPGFEIKWMKLLKIAYVTMLYADALSQMYHSVVFREMTEGATEKLKDKYIALALPLLKDKNSKGLIELLKLAVADFNAVPVYPQQFPVIGLVGEIYLKYNKFGQYNIINWLNKQGIEVIVPPLHHFMMSSLVNRKVDQKENIAHKTTFTNIVINAVELLAGRYAGKTEKIMSGFRYYRPTHDIYDSARHASEIVNLINQYGEGWLIPAEISLFAKSGVNNVISIQPFGCIANHIIAKGVEKKIKSIYPEMKLQFLDFDGGTSEVNIQNRLHFMMQRELMV